MLKAVAEGSLTIQILSNDTDVFVLLGWVAEIAINFQLSLTLFFQRYLSQAYKVKPSLIAVSATHP